VCVFPGGCVNGTERTGVDKVWEFPGGFVNGTECTGVDNVWEFLGECVDKIRCADVDGVRVFSRGCVDGNEYAGVGKGWKDFLNDSEFMMKRLFTDFRKFLTKRENPGSQEIQVNFIGGPEVIPIEGNDEYQYREMIAEEILKYGEYPQW